MSFVRRYIFSTDHKVIGQQYFFLALFSVFIGIFLSVMMRFHLSYPDAKVRLFERLWPDAAAGEHAAEDLGDAVLLADGNRRRFVAGA